MSKPTPISPDHPISNGIPHSGRAQVDGKFFRVNGEKFPVKGVTYGPFAPDASGSFFAAPEQTERDFRQIVSLGANVIRTYYMPPAWLLDQAGLFGLKVFVDIPWPKHLCFLDSPKLSAEARQTVREAVRAGGGHSAILAYSVVNEIPSEIVRWTGVKRVERFIDQLLGEAREVDPGGLYTFTSFPPTEFLQPETADFNTFNVYLHDRVALEGYLARLQTLADQRPLVLGEFGMDSLREGREVQAEFLSWQIESAFRGGAAGTVVFSFSDDWFRGGHQIEDWAFGLTTRDRQPKPSFARVREQYRQAPRFPLSSQPKVSVVVASYNGARTLENCLSSLTRLNYPDYEVLLVDDGSTDDTPEMARRYPSVRYLPQTNLGLSAARNAGIKAARGEIIAFTDSDCRADEDWLHYLVQDLLREDWVGVGGHNFLPPDDSAVAAAVMASPGGPAHVMISDRVAEHIPGCNMAFYKWALESLDGFDPVFRKAGDDVDICWRLQQCGHTIGFSAAGFVWHYRRSTIKAYFKQQAGYGEAEALLAVKHPEYFNFSGNSIWRGRIYALGKSAVVLQTPVIYHGIFGSGFFQRLYSAEPVLTLMLSTSLGYHVCVNLPLLVGAVYLPWLWSLALASLAGSLGICVLGAGQASLPPRHRRAWSRPLVALLFFLQPIVRGWARLAVRLNLRSLEGAAKASPRFTTGDEPFCFNPDLVVAYWGKEGPDRLQFLQSYLELLRARGWFTRPDSGWGGHDLEIQAGMWGRLRLLTTAEDHDERKRVLRCRFRTHWSLPTWLLLIATSGLALILIREFSPLTPWIWTVLTVIPFVHWYVSDEQARWQRGAEISLDQAAAQQGLIKL